MIKEAKINVWYKKSKIYNEKPHIHMSVKNFGKAELIIVMDYPSCAFCRLKFIKECLTNQADSERLGAKITKILLVPKPEWL